MQYLALWAEHFYMASSPWRILFNDNIFIVTCYRLTDIIYLPNNIRDLIVWKLLNRHTEENSFTRNHGVATSLTGIYVSGGRRRRLGVAMVEGHTKPGKRDKYLLEQGFSLWSTIRAILTSPPLGRQKMPVSRCARLKNDRRGAKPGSTALPLFLALSHPLSFLPPLFVFLHLDPPLSCHPSPSRDDASSLLL